MPEMTGFELCQRMRSHPRHSKTDVIMLTAKGLELELSRLKDEFDVADVFAKPFSPSDLVKAVDDRLATRAT